MSKSQEPFITHKIVPSEPFNVMELFCMESLYPAQNGELEGTCLGCVERSELKNELSVCVFIHLERSSYSIELFYDKFSFHDSAA